MHDQFEANVPVYADLLEVINNWGPCPAPPDECEADVSPPGGDGLVNTAELLMAINDWG